MQKWLVPSDSWHHPGHIIPACYGQYATLIVFLLFFCYEEKDRSCYHVSLFLNFVWFLVCLVFLSYNFDYVVLQGNCETSITFVNIGRDCGKEERMCGSTQTELFLVLTLQPELEVYKWNIRKNIILKISKSCWWAKWEVKGDRGHWLVIHRVKSNIMLIVSVNTSLMMQWKKAAISLNAYTKVKFCFMQ